MIDFINQHEVLAASVLSCIIAVFSSVATIAIENKKRKVDELKMVKCELKDVKEKFSQCQEKLNEITSIEYMEKNIDKGTGSIYSEKLDNGGRRNICGFCWEEEHLKIPIIVDLCGDDDNLFHGHCEHCKKECYEKLPF